MKVILKNITLKEIANEDFRHRGTEYYHPLVMFALEHGGNLCGSCKIVNDCEAVARVATLSTFYPMTARVTRCEMFLPNREGNIEIEEI